MRRTRTDERPSRLAKETKGYREGLEALGNRVRALRDKRGLTLERAAEQMTMDLTHLAKIEFGKVNVTFVTLVRIANGLGVSIRDLFPAAGRGKGRSR